MPGNNDIIQLFAEYSSGMLEPIVLKSRLQQAQMKRAEKKGILQQFMVIDDVKKTPIKKDYRGNPIPIIKALNIKQAYGIVLDYINKELLPTTADVVPFNKALWDMPQEVEKFVVVDSNGERIHRTTNGMPIRPFEADSLNHAVVLVRPWIENGLIPQGTRVIPYN